MAKYIIKRVAMGIFSIFIVATVTFFVMNLVPGGPFVAEKSISAAAQQALAEKYGLLLIMEQGKGTRYEHLRPTMVALIAEQIEPLLADEENALLLAQIMADNLVGGIIQILKNRVRPREVRVCMNRLLDYHTKGIHALRVE